MAKLYRSRTESMIAGVAGGLGQYLGIDSTWVRLSFVLMCFLNGVGFWVYLVMALVIQRVPEGQEIVPTDQPFYDNPDLIKIAGGVLVALGLVALVDNFNFPWMAWATFRNLWPVLMVGAGGFMLYRSFNSEEEND